MADAEGLRDGPFIPSRADAMSRAVAAPLLPSLGKRREVLENKTSSLFNVSEFSLLQSERRRGFFFFLNGFVSWLEVGACFVKADFGERCVIFLLTSQCSPTQLIAPAIPQRGTPLGCHQCEVAKGRMCSSLLT